MRVPMLVVMRLLLGTISVGLLCACGASAHQINPVKVSGTVARVCLGPPVAGRPPRCLQTAVLSNPGHGVTVRGRFTVMLPPGRYRVTVDGCPQRAPLIIKRAVSGLRLAPMGCAFPA
jgi:hypothetical protein